MTQTRIPLTRSIVTMSMTLAATTVVLLNACSATDTSNSSVASSLNSGKALQPLDQGGLRSRLARRYR